MEERTFFECIPGWTIDQLVSRIAPTDGQPSNSHVAAMRDVDGLVFSVLQQILRNDPTDGVMVLIFLVHLVLKKNLPLCRRRIDGLG